LIGGEGANESDRIEGGRSEEITESGGGWETTDEETANQRDGRAFAGRNEEACERSEQGGGQRMTGETAEEPFHRQEGGDERRDDGSDQKEWYPLNEQAKKEKAGIGDPEGNDQGWHGSVENKKEEGDGLKLLWTLIREQSRS
jgi:hypothetical protein